MQVCKNQRLIYWYSVRPIGRIGASWVIPAGRENSTSRCTKLRRQRHEFKFNF